MRVMHVNSEVIDRIMMTMAPYLMPATDAMQRLYPDADEAGAALIFGMAVCIRGVLIKHVDDQPDLVAALNTLLRPSGFQLTAIN